MRKTHLYQILFLIGFWVLAAVFIVCYKGAILEFKPPPDQVRDDISYSFSRTLLLVVLVTSVSAAAIASFEVLYFNPLLRQQPFGRTLLVKAGFYLLNIFCFTSLAILLVYSRNIGQPLIYRQVLEWYRHYLVEPPAVRDGALLGVCRYHGTICRGGE